MTESWMIVIAIPIAIFITYLVYKYNLLGDGKGQIGTRQSDSVLEKWIFKRLKI